MNAGRRPASAPSRRVRYSWALLLLTALRCFAQDSSPATTSVAFPTYTPAPAVGHPEDAFANPANWYGLDAPTSPEYELDEILAPHTGMFSVPVVTDATSALMDKQRQLQEDIGLRVGFFYAQLYQQASGGPNTRWGMSGDADFLLDWTLIGRGTNNTGRFVLSVEDRFGMSQITPAQLRGQIGTLVATTGAFNDRGLVVRDAFWDQRLFNAKLRILIGRAAPDDYVGSHRLQTSNFGFFNGNLSGNVTTAFPGHGPTALVSAHPNDFFYVTGGAANAYSSTTNITIDSLFDEGRYYGFGETGITPTIPGIGRGRYAVTGWYMPDRPRDFSPHDSGLSFTAEQYVSTNLWLYGRYGFADQGVITGVQQAWQAAIGIDGLLGSKDNLTAVGFGYAVPAAAGLRDEKSIEVFQRFQVTKFTQFTVGAQLFVDPSNAPDDNVLAVFSFRLRVDL